MLKNKTLVPCLFYFLLSILIYAQGLSVHGMEYRDDEVFYFNSAKEMVASGDYLSPKYLGEDRFQKPILYYWLIVICYKIFGVSWFSARLTSVIFSGLTVSLTWLMARRLFAAKHIAHLSALILMTCPLFFRHAKNVVPDMTLTFFIVLSCFSILFIQDAIDNTKSIIEERRCNYIFFISMASGFMIKGIAAVAVPLLLLFVYFTVTQKKKYIKQMNWLRGIGLFLLICLPWFIYMVLRHGTDYMDYMLAHETQNRILGIEQKGGFLVARLKQFGKNSLFYLTVLFQYFAPWSIFIIAAIPLAIGRISKNHKDRESLVFILSWMGIVFVMFSFMDFKISHYMMSLSAGYALLLGYFMNEIFSSRLMQGKIFSFIRTNYLILMIVLCSVVYTFLVVYLLQWNPWVIMVIIAGCVYAVCIIKLKKSNVLPAYILAGVMLFILFQSPLLAKASLTPHSTLQRVAAVVNTVKQDDYILGVGSHDLHEKELQVYFDQKVERLVTTHEGHNIYHLTRMFNYSKDVFCLMTEKDYNHYFSKEEFKKYKTEILTEEYLARKRFFIDKGFFTALLQMDQQKVYHYIMEKIVLIRKVQDA